MDCTSAGVTNMFAPTDGWLTHLHRLLLVVFERVTNLFVAPLWINDQALWVTNLFVAPLWINDQALWVTNLFVTPAHEAKVANLA